MLSTDSVEIRVFAVEMCLVTTGGYLLGSGGTEYNHFYDGANANMPYNVQSENAITVGTSAGNLYYDNGGGVGGDQTGPIPATFPKGFSGFWIMKYEASQQQYVDFLNTIDAARAGNRTPGGFTGTHPNLVAPAPERAITNLNLADNIAFADWSGMRPITEMEYEKACRGYNQAATPNEYAWGNTTVSATTTITNPALDNESATDGNANYGSTISRPVRCGIYATATSTRTSSGGTYYGIMEMSGNVYEPTVSVAFPGGRAYTGKHGDGYLDANGDANVQDWPTTNGGYSIRGGSFSDNANLLRVSDRNYGYSPFGIGTRTYIGVRVGRTAE